MRFEGVKILLCCGENIITIQRDNKPGLRFANMWDLPGGGREGDETPIETAQREVFEELSIVFSPETVYYEKQFPAINNPTEIAYLLAATVTEEQIQTIVFGDEGQGWEMTTIDDFIVNTNAVPFLRQRLSDYRHDFVQAAIVDV